MDTYAAPGGHRGNPTRLRLVSDAAAFDTVRHSKLATRETDERARFRVAVAVALLPSMALWALIWFALTHLIAQSADVGRAFRLMSATHSDRSRPAVPIDVGRGGAAPAGRATIITADLASAPFGPHNGVITITGMRS